MPSMMNQRALFQREVTPGTPLVDAMRDVKGLKVRPSYAVEGERFKSSGSKVATANVINNVSGAPAVEVANDFNAWTYALTGAYGRPTSAFYDADGVGANPASTVAVQHEYAISATAADPRVSFTVMWGDSTAAVQMPYFTFNGFGATLSRQSGSSSAQAFSSEPINGVPLPTAGVTSVGSVPIAGRTWTAYITDTWAELATVTDADKVDAMYEATISMDGKYEQDYQLDADIPSFADVLEADVTYTLGLSVGWTSQARANLVSMKNGDVKFVRLESVGPLIETGVNYRATMDFAITLTNVGEFTTAPNSQAVTLPFEGELFVDPVSGNVSRVTLINTVPAL